VFRQWLKGLQRFAVAVCHSSHVADEAHRHRARHTNKEPPEGGSSL
jgi:hypothetical protein